MVRGNNSCTSLISCAEASNVICGSPRSNLINILFVSRWKFKVLAGRLPYEVH